MSQYRFHVRNKAALEYFDQCARIRNISVSALIQRLVETIANEQMIAAVLDDDAMRTRRPGEHPYRTPKSMRQ